MNNLVNYKQLIKIASLEKYKRLFKYLLWNYVTNSFIYLKEFEVGLDGTEFLIFLTDYYKNQLSEKEYKNNLYLLWYFYLKLLDKADRWQEYINNFNKLRNIPHITHPHGNRHITSETPLITRYKIIEKKIAHQRQRKSVNHLRHKQRNDISNEEYKRRRRLLKYWINHGQWLIE